MWFAFCQRLLSWFGVRGNRVESVSKSEDFRTSEPVLTDSLDLQMGHVGNANVQVGQNSGSVKVVNLKQERVTHIHVYGGSEGRQDNAAKSSAPISQTTPEQREVLRLMRQLRSRESTYAFMQKNFGTKMVIDLKPGELIRVRKYVESINERVRKARRVES